MTIGGWIIFALLAFFVAFFGFMWFVCSNKISSRNASVIVSIIVIVLMFFGFRWYFNNTASGRRQLVDQRSDLAGGIERVVNVYTANGDVIAKYAGKIDIAADDGGYVKFDFDGKRYIYYNCFVETIANIE